MIKIATFTVPGNPKPKERPRFGRGRGYTTEATRAAEARVASSFRDNLGVRHTIESPVTGPLRVRLRFFRENMRRVDLDNLAKIPLDALNKLAWVDDSQIMSLIASKHLDRDNPRTEIELWATKWTR
ncbi:RusA family crossover junction endodeoxyribonuclease [Curtobacterium sp. SORGH_AS_0776]|uniref:RusA family crossover junction endodeoxyribonuclease n=1 Tax=Curtobacterium sp. SORGH_AS_0776 TaxID=3041798 RepID=UPI0028541F82|nr:RusA family crossover junction endodeoxyribonuclease [Curtobacterium sp. SORGH_AS_0776]MDR6172622.1 Holliday junction resolvase RusA-like endonuclease [Curtobacterium sp. SORGH_AS_0776]